MTATIHPVLGVIPARGGSKGLARKNLNVLAGLPLVAHSIRMAQMTPEISECVVSTEDSEISEVAQKYGGNVPFRRPAELAHDDTSMLPVLQHALMEMEKLNAIRYGSVLLLQPTGPTRTPEDASRAIEILSSDDAAAGVVAVSLPSFNPRWVCVEERGGYLQRCFPRETYACRQEVSPVYRINGLLYLFRREHVLAGSNDFWNAPLKPLVIPDERVIDIDSAHDFEIAELLLRNGIIRLPWLSEAQSR
jgi:CMP-N,N'-diacetyllegionaminic acid synthase